MLKIYGFATYNTMKVLYTATHLGLDFEYIQLDPMKGEHKTDEYKKLHPLGKVPAMDHDGQTLFESGAICRYLGLIEKTPAYPQDGYARAQVDQWMDFFSCHLGRWLGTAYFENYIKTRASIGPANPAALEEALGFIHQQADAVNAQLKSNSYLTGREITIADYFAFSYFETTEKSKVDISDFTNIETWFEKLADSDVVKKVHKDFGTEF